MTPISVVLAIGAPLLHARVRGVLISDPGTMLVHDAVSGLDAVRLTEHLGPRIVLCDRQMLADPHFVGFQAGIKSGPLVVMVTVNSDAMRSKSSLTISGTIPFDTRPGDMGSRLFAILQAAALPEPAEAARLRAPAPVVARLSGRFSIPEKTYPTPTFTPPVPVLPAQEAPVCRPVPTKTAQLKRTSFLKSMLDDGDSVYGRERASLVS
jgi:hypothetical protein